MWPVVYESGVAGGAPLAVHTYGVLMLSAFTAAFAMVHFRSRAIGFQPDRLVPVYIAAAVGGLVGARVLYSVAIDPGRVIEEPAALLLSGGFAFYGGLIGGAVMVLLVGRVLAFPGWKLVDLLAPALVLGLGIGRVGCFFSGCCHGAVAPIGEDRFALFPDGMLGGQLWWSRGFPYLTTEFHGGVGRLLDLPLYPTQLWSAGAALGLAALLGWMWRHRVFDGQIFGMMLVLEPIARIVIEAFRADQRGTVIEWAVTDEVMAWLPGMAQAGGNLHDGSGPVSVGLTTSQSIGLVMIVIGVVILVVRRNAGVAPEVPIASEDPLALPLD